MATVINGTNFLISVDGTSIGASKSCKLTLNHSVRDTFTKDDAGWKTNAEGSRDWSVTCDGFMAMDATGTTLDDLVDMIINRTKAVVKMQTTTDGDTYWYGNAYLKSVDVDSVNEESVSFSIAFDGDGELTQSATT